MIQYGLEGPGESRAREALLDRCFGRARRFKTSERLRRGRLPAPGLALVAREDGILVATVRLWEVEAGTAGPALLLGPLAVAPERQGQGIGSTLMRLALARAAELGHRAVILVGDAAYYERFGFRPGPMHGLAMPGPVEAGRFLARELVPGALSGAAGLIVPTGALKLPAERRRRLRAA